MSAADVTLGICASGFLAERNDDAILAWHPDALPPDWEHAQRRSFHLNRVRAVITWTAFALFVAAAYAFCA